MPRSLRLASGDDGQALVETVLLFPFLLIMVLVLMWRPHGLFGRLGHG